MRHKQVRMEVKVSGRGEVVRRGKESNKKAMTLSTRNIL